MDEGVSDHLTAPVDSEAAHETAAAAVALPDRWRLLELLGSGGQATVWLAEDRTLGQRVALKILPADADERTRGRWLEEVRQGRRLSHPHLIRIFDVVETSDRPVAVMEYVSGGTLADRVVAGGSQPIEDVIRWTGEVLEVLGYLHDDRIVHRDVKPSNLLITKGGGLKLSDLGLVRSLDRGSDLTRTLEGVGTPRFMSPEQLRGEVPTPACDLYSLGITMYQLLTGRLPFDGDSAFQIADGHLHSRPVGVREHRPECPRWLARFVERLLEKSPTDRFRSAGEAMAALERQRVGYSRRTVGGVALAAVVAVAAFLGFFSIRSMMEPEIDRVEIQGSEVVARAADGSRLWSSQRPDHLPKVVTADFSGDRRPEVAIGWSTAKAGEGPEDSAFFEIHSTTGEVIRSIRTSHWAKDDFPDLATVWHLKELKVGNLDGDGPDLVWGLPNPRWYPAILGATKLRGSSEQPLVQLSNSGHLQSLTLADLDGDGQDEIVAVLVNNPMGFQRVLVTMGARSRSTGELCGVMRSPDIKAFLQARAMNPEGCLSFTPLGSDVLLVEPPEVTAGGIRLVADGEIRRFDVWGNPEGSPLFGNGPAAREAFWEDLTSVCARIRLESIVEPPFTLDRLRESHPEVMAEAPTEVGSYLIAARALASGGHRENAITLLGEGVGRHPGEHDLQLRLGEQLLIDGARDEGRARIAESVNLASSGRNHNDQVYMLIFDAAVNGDLDDREETRRFIANLSATATSEAMTFLDAAWFFFQGEWGDPRIADVDPGSIHRWVRVLRQWARFETSGDVEESLKRSQEFAATEEIGDLARVFEARLRLAGGDAREAAQLADQALTMLEIRCRVDYEACVWVPLAERVLGEALLSVDGRRGDAVAVLARAAEHAPNTWIATPLTR